MATNPRAEAFEREVNKQEKSMLAHRARRVKREGYKSEKDYFTHTHPFKNTDAKHSKSIDRKEYKGITKALKNAMKD
jgi:hypothetical protein